MPMEVELVQARVTTHSSTKVRTCDARVVLPNTVFKEATSRHVAVEPARLFLASDPLLVFNMLHYSLLCEFVRLRGRQTLHKKLLLVVFRNNPLNEIRVLRVIWAQSVPNNLFELKF